MVIWFSTVFWFHRLILQMSLQWFIIIQLKDLSCNIFFRIWFLMTLLTNSIFFLGWTNLATDIGLVYDNMGEYSNALSYLERALSIFQSSLPPDHLHIQSVRSGMEIIKKEIVNLGLLVKRNAFHLLEKSVLLFALSCAHRNSL